MRLLFLGDVVGRAGRLTVTKHLPYLIDTYKVDFTVVNGENAAAGFGITEKIAGELFDAGADVITTGNHVWDQKEALVFIERQPQLLRPINFPEGTPGKGVGLYEGRGGARVLVINAMGRVFMQPLEDPFVAVEKELDACPLGDVADAVLVDFHGEATSEKMAMGHFCDGRASLVVGTHSHVPTGDTHIMSGGTAYQTDAGMCGDYDSVIGMEKEEPLHRFVRGYGKGRFVPAQGEATLCGVLVDVGADGQARRAAPIRMGGKLAETLPDWE
ncbi:MAG: TIGR00282 family metallophosphoesterase [Alphaproteobacteria bacterium]|nr:MAG: TIGR00282 family metallophosphoesterase [Alphaproteobacteria bacterium]